jgi:hypothetical protein
MTAAITDCLFVDLGGFRRYKIDYIGDFGGFLNCCI